jgi:acyl-CoA dehydrogenase
MSVELTDEQIDIQGVVRRFVEIELFPYERILLEREVMGEPGNLSGEEARGLQEKARGSGLWGIDTPDEYGGADLDWVTQAIVNIELGRTFIPFRFGGSAPAVLYLGTDGQKERYLLPTINGERIYSFMLSEPGVGSDAMAVRTSARRSGAGWLINGEKTWITRGRYADYGLVFCRTPNDGSGLTAFLVDREMGWTSSPVHLMGRDDTASVSFVDVYVPEENVFGEVGRGLEIAMRFIHKNRAIMTAGRQIGAAERLLGMAVEHAKQRSTFGKPLAERDNIRFMIAQSDVDIRALKLLSLNAASLADRGVDMRHEACVAKYFGANAANRVVDRVLQIHGAMGISRELPIQRWYRDLRVERVYEGSDEMNLLSISRNLLAGTVEIGDVFGLSGGRK